MFGNIGGKLKALAYFFCWGGIILCVIRGIVLMSKQFVLTGILTIILGALCSWISSWVIYAIGEIAENTKKKPSYEHPNTNIYGTDKSADQKRLESVFKSASNSNSATRRQCPHCGEPVASSICDMCGKKNDLFS